MSVSVRPFTYRDTPGFLISGRLSNQARPVRIFAENRRAAERIATKVRARAEIVPDDFTIFDGEAS